MRKHTHFFILCLFSAAFAAVFLFALQPQAASGASTDNLDLKLDMVLQELRILRDEVARLREDLHIASSSGVRTGRIDEMREASEIISELRTIKSVVILFYADNMDMGEDKLSSVITMSKDNVGSLFRTYLDNPGKYDGPEYTMAVKRVGTENIWLAGYNVSGKSNAVKGALRERAVSAGLLAEDMRPYTGGGIVYMRVR